MHERESSGGAPASTMQLPYVTQGIQTGYYRSQTQQALKEYLVFPLFQKKESFQQGVSRKKKKKSTRSLTLKVEIK